MTPFPQRQSSPGAFLVPGPRAVMAACGEFHDPTMILRYRPLNQPMSRLQTPGGDTVRRGSDISRLPVAGQDRTEPAERLCEQSVTFPSLLHQAQAAMSPIMSRRRAESSLEISRQLGPRARLLKPAPRRAPDGRLEGEQCPYCHYPDSNTCTILSACTVPPARTRPGSDPQAGASSGHSATSPPTMRGRRPAVAGMPSPARTRYAPTLSRSRRPAACRPGRAQAAIDRQRSCGNAAELAPDRCGQPHDRQPPIRPGRRSSPGPMKIATIVLTATMTVSAAYHARLVTGACWLALAALFAYALHVLKHLRP